MRILLVANSLMPSYGGPAYSVTRLARALAADGIETGLWAADGSAVSTPLLGDDSGVRTFTGSVAAAFDAFGRPDVVHDNGIWMPHHHAVAGLTASRSLPRLVSTRGMLLPWAMKHKRWKKRIAWWLYQRRDLQRAALHHATSIVEADHLRAMKLGVPVRMIPNGIDIPDLPRLTAGEAGDGKLRTALFLGRIYPVKGLPMLVQAWARVRPAGWVLKIAGPDEAGHRLEVERAIADAGLGGVVSFMGPLAPAEKRAALLAAELFVLPTHSENFGMAVGEALAHGLPVLTTTGAPWPTLEEKGCGWWVEPGIDAIAEGLRRATALEPATLKEMGARGRAFVAAEFDWSAVARAFRDAYGAVIAGEYAAR